MVGFTRPPCDAGIIRATPAFPAALSPKRKRLTLVATIFGSSMAFGRGGAADYLKRARARTKREYTSLAESNFRSPTGACTTTLLGAVSGGASKRK